MVKGFKDKDGKFHPIGQSGVSKHTRNARIRYANDIGSLQLLEQSVKDFATNRKIAFQEFKAKQQEKFEEELTLRRKFRVPLIRAFRQARDQEITKPRELEKFIRQQIPDLPKGKGINKFVEQVLKEFIKEEKRFKGRIAGKSEEEKEALEQKFELALKESESQFKKVQSDIDLKFSEQQRKEKEESAKKVKKLEEEIKESREAKRLSDERTEELRKIQRSEASEAEKQEAKKVAEQAEEKAEKEQKDETSFASEVISELKEETKEVKQGDFDFGFPEEIV